MIVIKQLGTQIEMSKRIAKKQKEFTTVML